MRTCFIVDEILDSRDFRAVCRLAASQSEMSSLREYLEKKIKEARKDDFDEGYTAGYDDGKNYYP